MHDVLMITYNRAEYTKLSLARLLESCDDEMRVWVWHNGDHQETLDVVKSMQDHPNFHHLEHSPENQKLRGPTNWFWEKSDGDFVTKVDDDCLLPDGWGADLRRMHLDNPELGIVGTWRFYDEDFVPHLANKKIIKLKREVEMMRNPWVQGSGYVMKREVIDQNGGIGEAESFPWYCIRAALAGWENGWAFPFIHEEHMDDPRSPFCLIKTDEDFMAQRPLSAINDNLETLADWAARVRYMAQLVQAASPDPRRHIGWWRRWNSLKRRAGSLIGLKEPWRANASKTSSATR